MTPFYFILFTMKKNQEYLQEKNHQKSDITEDRAQYTGASAIYTNKELDRRTPLRKKKSREGSMFDFREI